MKLAVITVCHAEPEIIAFGLIRLFKTAGYAPDFHLLVDNAWPVNQFQTSLLIDRIADGFNCVVHSLGYNVGGHAGFNRGLSFLQDCGWGNCDFILLYDPDSNPITNNWLVAMVDVMRADSTMGYLSLLDNRIVESRPWNFEMIAGHKVATHPQPDMFNVTLFRASVLEKGLLADRPLYGKVEDAMDRHVTSLGMRRGYLYDFREAACPILHPNVYEQWKLDHAKGVFPGNFDEYIHKTV